MRASTHGRGPRADQAGRARHQEDGGRGAHYPEQRAALADFEDYLDGFSPNVQDILENLKFRNQLPTLSKADALATLINKFLDPDIGLSPAGIDNHAMGTVFEELGRKFTEDNNEEAGEHGTPRDTVRLMANLVFMPVEGQLKSGTYLSYDDACGTGSMLTVAEETLTGIGARRGLDIKCGLYGQEINPETYAICKADMLIKGEGENADHIFGGAEWSTLAHDAFPGQEFDFMVANPPYGKSWKKDLLLRPREVSSRIAPSAILEVANDALRSLLKHRHVFVGGGA